ncbi:MAG: ribbon-helix-helix domain-containing protein [Candidatus Bathyarchaeota archaeon]|nr:ribbon-helix-helix domain-containing protein [Candidatus Bathyarchaeota archaeon]
MLKRKTATWNIQVPKALDEAVNVVVAKYWHYTKVEFIREAVREKLKSLGISPAEPFKDTPIPEN